MSTAGGPQLTFRPLKSEDLRAISLVHRRACLIAYQFMNWAYPLEEVEAWYSPKLAGWTWTQGAFDADALAGFIALSGRHIDQLFIDPHYQRSGLGSALLLRALDSARGTTTLHVFEANQNARAFYAKHGFRERDRWMNTQDGAVELLYVRES
jgi:GNAT superfamily N-acetyltransferase